MEPTQKKAGGGNRPSAAKRYGPIGAIIAIIVVIAIVVVATGGGDDEKSDSTTTTNSGQSAKVWPTFTEATKDSGDWGPHCDPKTGRVAIPYTQAPACADVGTGDNGGATAPGVTADSIKVVIYQGDPAKNPLQSATVKGAGAVGRPLHRP